MRKIGIAVAAVAAAALAPGIAGFGAGSTSSEHPSLRLLKAAPVTLAGSHFRSSERVRVTVTVVGARSARVVRASGKGSFVAGFTTGAGRCSTVRAVAVGTAGSRAVLKYLPAPGCLPV
ncbi:MAG TPA: hypothetical protein VGJ27_05565 [Gaiellaceae bacterium]|jgi:hypothetical protein